MTAPQWRSKVSPFTVRSLIASLQEFAGNDPAFLDKPVAAELAAGEHAVTNKPLFVISYDDDFVLLSTKRALEVWNRGEPPCPHCGEIMCSEDFPLCPMATAEQQKQEETEE